MKVKVTFFFFPSLTVKNFFFTFLSGQISVFHWPFHLNLLYGELHSLVPLSKHVTFSAIQSEA